MLDVELKPLNLKDDMECNLVVMWDSDPEIVDYIFPRKNKEDSYPFKTGQSLWKHLLRKTVFKKLNYMAYYNGVPFGMCGIIIDPDFLLNKVKNTAWLGLNIGDKSFWGKGFGQHLIKMMETISKKRGCVRVEIGTFSFNHRAIKMFKQLGYKEIGRISNFTYHDNKMWDDIRFEKHLR